jgi:holliday junction DNA helicase RuvA
MIGQLTGTLIDKNPPEVVVDCHGVGYEVSVPMSTFYNLPALGEKVKLLTHFVVREDAQLLYGFATQEERAAFRQLIKISGVGPRTALSVLSGMGVADLAQAITQQEAGRLVKVPGIGKKNRRAFAVGIEGQDGRRPGSASRHFSRSCQRHSASLGGPGILRQGSRACAQILACRHRCERWHQNGTQGLGQIKSHHEHSNRRLWHPTARAHGGRKT